MSLKENRYERLYQQLLRLLDKNTCLIAQLATINAILKHKNPSFFWVGFYFKQNNRLLVGPYQGPLACQELEYSKGVCWTSVLQQKDIIVNNVEEFPDHIACNSLAKSEIVLPLYNSAGNIVSVLDIDSDKKSNFDKLDLLGLRKILSIINKEYIDDFFKL